MPTTNEHELLTDETLGKLLGKSKFWVAEQSRRGRLPHLKVGNRRRYTDAHVTEILRLFDQPTVDPLARSPRSRKGRAA